MTMNAIARRVGGPVYRFSRRNGPASGGRIGAAVRNAMNAAAAHLGKTPEAPARPMQRHGRTRRGGGGWHRSEVGRGYCEWTAERKWEDDGGRVGGAGSRAPGKR